MTRRGFLVAGGILALSMAPAATALGHGNAADTSRFCDPDLCVVPATSHAPASGHAAVVFAVLPRVDAGVPSPPLRHLGTPVSADIFRAAPVDGSVSARGPPPLAGPR